MDQIDIDQDTLAAFKSGEQESGGGISEGSQDSQKFDDRATAALKGIDKSLKWLIDTGDKKMKEAGGDGIGGDSFRADYHELWMINIEDWAKQLENDEILKKSPRVMLGLVTVGIIAPNAYDIYKNNTGADPDPEQEQEKQKEGEE